jgi:hypothetical protein
MSMNIFCKPLALIVVASAPTLLSACGSSVAGEYTCELGPVSGLVLGSGGKASASSPLSDRVAEGSYEVDGSKVTVRIGDTAELLTYADGVLSSSDGKCTKK